MNRRQSTDLADGPSLSSRRMSDASPKAELFSPTRRRGSASVDVRPSWTSTWSAVSKNRRQSTDVTDGPESDVTPRQEGFSPTRRRGSESTSSSDVGVSKDRRESTEGGVSDLAASLRASPGVVMDHEQTRARDDGPRGSANDPATSPEGVEIPPASTHRGDEPDLQPWPDAGPDESQDSGETASEGRETRTCDGPDDQETENETELRDDWSQQQWMALHTTENLVDPQAESGREWNREDLVVPLIDLGERSSTSELDEETDLDIRNVQGNASDEDRGHEIRPAISQTEPDDAQSRGTAAAAPQIQSESDEVRSQTLPVIPRDFVNNKHPGVTEGEGEDLDHGEPAGGHATNSPTGYDGTSPDKSNPVLVKPTTPAGRDQARGNLLPENSESWEHDPLAIPRNGTFEEGESQTGQVEEDNLAEGDDEESGRERPADRSVEAQSDEGRAQSNGSQEDRVDETPALAEQDCGNEVGRTERGEDLMNKVPQCEDVDVNRGLPRRVQGKLQKNPDEVGNRDAPNVAQDETDKGGGKEHEIPKVPRNELDEDRVPAIPEKDVPKYKIQQPESDGDSRAMVGQSSGDEVSDQDRIRRLQTKLADVTAETEQLRALSKNLLSELRQARDEHHKTRRELSSQLEDKSDTLEAALREMKSILGEGAQNPESAGEIVGRVREAFLSLRREKETLTTTVGELEDELSWEDRASVQASLETLHQNLRGARHRVEALQEEQARKNQIIECLREERRAERESHDSKLQRLQEENATLHDKLAEAKERWYGEFRELSRRLEERREEADDLLRCQRDRYEAKLEELLEDKQNEASRLRAQTETRVLEVTTEKQTLEERLAASEKDRENLREMIVKLNQARTQSQESNGVDQSSITDNSNYSTGSITLTEDSETETQANECKSNFTERQDTEIIQEDDRKHKDWESPEAIQANGQKQVTVPHEALTTSELEQQLALARMTLSAVDRQFRALQESERKLRREKEAGVQVVHKLVEKVELQQQSLEERGGGEGAFYREKAESLSAYVQQLQAELAHLRAS